MGIASRDSLRKWLHAPGSLSRRLACLGERFEVTVLSQRTAPLRTAELKALGLPRHGCTVVREVILSVDGRPLVWARSSLHQSALAGPWRALKGLGPRPLANLLYADPRVRRSELRPRRLSRFGHTRPADGKAVVGRHRQPRIGPNVVVTQLCFQPLRGSVTGDGAICAGTGRKYADSWSR